MSHQKNLISKITTKKAVIAIIGLGYVGLPLARLFCEQGFSVIGLDVDESKVQALTQGRTYIKHVDASFFAHQQQEGLFTPSTDFSQAAAADALILCVPTPLDEHREPDLSYVIGSVETLIPHLRPGQILCLESTTYPGTTHEELRPRLEMAGFGLGQDFFLAYSPEREDPNNQKYTTHNIPKVCGGETPACLEVGQALYEQVISRVVPVSSTQAAEMTKILENTFRAVNIALVNELKMVAHRMGIDIFEVIRAAATKPFGYMPFYPGPGLGGHCIPIDPFYLTWKAREYGLHTRFIEVAGDVNTSMPQWVVHRIADALNDHGKAIKGSHILVLGVAYKKNVDDMRESPSVHIMDMLRHKGAQVDYSDPYVPNFPKLRKFAFDLQSQPLTPESIASYDCLLLATDHDDFDYEMIKQSAQVVVDTRGRYANGQENVWQA
jgi:UDP-N-acetyl-D-glucosamine dehydrogenase